MILAYLQEYGILNEEEVEQFKTEFGRYLLTNGIDSDAWEKLKAEDMQMADRIFHLFSVNVLDGIIERIDCLEFRTPEYAQFLALGNEKMRMIGITRNNDDWSLAEALSIDDLVAADASVQYSERIYSKNRTEDTMELTSKGYRPCDLKIFNELLFLTGREDE